MTQRVSLHYAAVPSQLVESLEAEWLPRLPAPKAAAIRRLRVVADRNASLLGIALLGAACAELGAEFDPAALEYPDYGKPQLRGGPNFSISHTRGLVACAAAASGRVGLDIETSGSVTARVAERILSPGERAAVERGVLSSTDAWVMKEAVVKLAGRSIGALEAVALEAQRATLEGEGYWLESVALAAARATLAGAGYWLEPVALPVGFVAWLASDVPTRRVSVHAAAAAPLPTRR